MEEYEEDGYEDYDDYVEVGYEQEEEGEEEYDERPSAESQEYLELRARIKERIRKKLQRENGSALSKSQEMKKKSSDNYGSFFGPSQPVIAPRVIQESKTLLENPHLLFKSSKPQNNGKTSSSSTGAKNRTHDQIPKVRNELITKVQKIKDTRDYSFLLSDDAELPTTTRPPVSQNTSASKSDARTAPMPRKSKQPTGDSSRYNRGGREEGKANLTSGRVLPKSGAHGSASSSRPSLTSVDCRAQLHNNGTGPGRPGASMDSGRQLQRKDATRPVAPIDSRRQSQSSNGTGPGRPAAPMDSRRQSQSSNGTGPGRPVSAMDSRYQKQSNNGSVPGRPVASADRRRQIETNGRPIPKGGTSQAPLANGQNKASAPGGKAILPPARKPLPPKMQSSFSKQEVERKRVLQEPKKALANPKHSVASSRSQVPSRPPMQENRLKRKSSRPFGDEDEDGDPLQMIRKMFNCARYMNRDDDDDDIEEAHFDDILEEEERSARIAKKEDEEQLRLIEEEERRERMRKMAKKRKLSHH